MTTDAENEAYFTARYAEARTIFPLLSYPTFTHNFSTVITTEELNVAGLAVFNLPPGFDVPAIDVANHTVKHEAGHAYLRRLERLTGIPRAVYIELFRVRFGYPVNYGVANYTSGYSSLGEAWAEVFCNACEGAVVTSKSYLDEQVDPLVARSWFQSQDPAYVPTPPSLPASTAVVDLRPVLPFVPGNQPVPSHHEKSSVTVHWPGEEFTADTDEQAVALIKKWAQSHINKDWNEIAPGSQGGAGLMYAEVIARSGTTFITRDPDAVCWHSNSVEGNATSRPILVLCSWLQLPTPAQYAALESRLAFHAVPHQRWVQTACPGPKLIEWLAGLEDDMSYTEADRARDNATAVKVAAIEAKVNAGFDNLVKVWLRRMFYGFDPFTRAKVTNPTTTPPPADLP